VAGLDRDRQVVNGRADHPSARVRLEAALLDVALLDAHGAVPAPAPALGGDASPTVLVVAAEADLRRYVRECLRDRPALRLAEAATLRGAVALAARHPPACLVVDERERDVLAALASYRAVLLLDDLPHAVPTRAPRVRLLARPFTAAELVAEIDRLIG
jgi:hypothetical protein